MSRPPLNATVSFRTNGFQKCHTVRALFTGTPKPPFQSNAGTRLLRLVNLSNADTYRSICFNRRKLIVDLFAPKNPNGMKKRYFMRLAARSLTASVCSFVVQRRCGEFSSKEIECKREVNGTVCSSSAGCVSRAYIYECVCACDVCTHELNPLRPSVYDKFLSDSRMNEDTGEPHKLHHMKESTTSLCVCVCASS